MDWYWCYASYASAGLTNYDFQRVFEQFFPGKGNDSTKLLANQVFQNWSNDTTLKFVELAECLSVLLRAPIDEKLEFVFEEFTMDNSDLDIHGLHLIVDVFIITSREYLLNKFGSIRRITLKYRLSFLTAKIFLISIFRTSYDYSRTYRRCLTFFKLKILKICTLLESHIFSA